MKKLFLFFIVFFLSLSHSFAASGNIDIYTSKNLTLSSEIIKLDTEILKLKDDDYKKYEYLITKTGKEIQFKENEKIIFCAKENIKCDSTSGYNTNQKNQLAIYKQQIDNYKNLKTEYEKKYKSLKDAYDAKKNEEARIAGQKAAEAEKQRLKLEAQRKASDALSSANQYYKNQNIDSAIEYYTLSCKWYETYDCLFGLANGYFKNAQKYSEKIKYFGYEKLYKNAIEEALNTIKKLESYTLTTDQKQKINDLKMEIQKFDHQDITPLKPISENKFSPQVQEILDLLEKKASIYDTQYRKVFYSSLYEQIQKFSEQQKDQNKKDFLEEILSGMQQRFLK